MTNSEIKSALTSVISTLNTIEIKGQDNMNRMLGCIILLGKIENSIGRTDAGTVEAENEPD